MDKFIRVTNPHLNNYGRVLAVREVDKKGVTVKDGFGSAEYYFEEDYQFCNEAGLDVEDEMVGEIASLLEKEFPNADVERMYDIAGTIYERFIKK